MENGSPAPARWPKQWSLLSPIQFDTNAWAVRGTISKRTMKGVLLRARHVGIGVEIVGIIDADGERGFEVLTKLQVIEPIAPLQALPDLIQIGPIDEPCRSVAHGKTPPAIRRLSKCVMAPAT